MGGVTGVCPHSQAYDNTRRRSPCLANQVASLHRRVAPMSTRCTHTQRLVTVGTMDRTPSHTLPLLHALASLYPSTHAQWEPR